MKRERKTSVEPILQGLQKGQVWVMQDQELSIIRTGKHLVEFRMLHRGQCPRANKLTRSSLETVSIVQKYLETNRAVLKDEVVTSQNN